MEEELFLRSNIALVVSCDSHNCDLLIITPSF